MSQPRIVSERGSRWPYEVVIEELKARLDRGHYNDQEMMPTELALAKEFGLSRGTIRRAYDSLVAEGLVVRAPGRGTQRAAPRQGPYYRSFGSVEDLMALAYDTELVLLSGPIRSEDPEISGVFTSPMKVELQRYHGDRIVVFTIVYLNRDIAESVLSEFSPGVRYSATILRRVDELTDGSISTVHQLLEARSCPSPVARQLGCDPGRPVLYAKRSYFDKQQTIVELAESYFHPDRYAYNIRLGRGK